MDIRILIGKFFLICCSLGDSITMEVTIFGKL